MIIVSLEIQAYLVDPSKEHKVHDKNHDEETDQDSKSGGERTEPRTEDNLQ